MNILFCFVGLRLLGAYNIFPFSQWDMFSVSRAEEQYAYLEVQDLEGHNVCIGTQCSFLFSVDKFSDVHYWINLMAGLQDGPEKRNFRTLVLDNLVSRDALHILVRVTKGDPKDFILAPKEQGRIVDEFQYRPR